MGMVLFHPSLVLHVANKHTATHCASTEISLYSTTTVAAQQNS